jgi:hypothetical protein
MSRALYFDFERGIVVAGETSEGKDGALCFAAESRVTRRATSMLIFSITARVLWTAIFIIGEIQLGMPKNALSLLPGFIIFLCIINPSGLINLIKSLRWPTSLRTFEQHEAQRLRYYTCGPRQLIIQELVPGGLQQYTDMLQPNASERLVMAQKPVSTELIFQSAVLIILIEIALFAPLSNSEISDSALGIVLPLIALFVLLIGLPLSVNIVARLNRAREKLS